MSEYNLGHLGVVLDVTVVVGASVDTAFDGGVGGQGTGSFIHRVDGRHMFEGIVGAACGVQGAIRTAGQGKDGGLEVQLRNCGQQSSMPVTTSTPWTGTATWSLWTSWARALICTDLPFSPPHNPAPHNPGNGRPPGRPFFMLQTIGFWGMILVISDPGGSRHAPRPCLRPP